MLGDVEIPDKSFYGLLSVFPRPFFFGQASWKNFPPVIPGSREGIQPMAWPTKAVSAHPDFGDVL